MPRWGKENADVFWPSDFSLVLDTFACHPPLAFGQHQMLLLSDYLMSFKGFKDLISSALPPFTDIQLEVSAQLGSLRGETR